MTSLKNGSCENGDSFSVLLKVRGEKWMSWLVLTANLRGLDDDADTVWTKRLGQGHCDLPRHALLHCKRQQNHTGTTNKLRRVNICLRQCNVRITTNLEGTVTSLTLKSSTVNLNNPGTRNMDLLSIAHSYHCITISSS